MYPRNAASPERVAIGPVVQISDGAVQTSGVSVSVLPIGTTASAGGGTIGYEQGIVHYTPTQAETNYTSFVLIAYKTGCIPATVTVVTTASGVAGYAAPDWAAIRAPTTTVNLSGTTISTSQAVASVSGAVGSVTGAVGSVTGNVGGNVVGSVASVATGGITAASFAAGAIDSAAIATDAIGALELAAGAAAEVATAVRTELATELARMDVAVSTRLASAGYTAPLDAAGVRAAVGLASANLDSQLDAVPTTSEIALAVWGLDVMYAGSASSIGLTLLNTYERAGNIKAVTDQMVFTTANRLDVQVFGLQSNTITAASLATDAATEVADAILARDLGSGTGAGTLDERTVRSALRAIRNRWTVASGTHTVYKEDDATTAWTAALSSSASADPVTGSDPT